LAKPESFRCEACDVEFKTRRERAGHRAGKHGSHRYPTCGGDFQSRGKLGRHRIEVHGFTKEQLGWNRGGWNRGLPKALAFPNARIAHGTAEFMRSLNEPAMSERKKTTRQNHEHKVRQKELELGAQGFRTFCTSNYMRHNRVSDIIAISSDGKAIAVELESMHSYKDSIEL
jgi:hypothetical protein